MFSAVIVMAGRGQRMQQNMNKALLMLGDKPVFMHSVLAFKPFCKEIILVVSKADYDDVLKYVESDKAITIVIGGESRGESVYNGLCHVNTLYALVHDAARPLIAKEVIEDCLTELKKDKAVLTYTPVKDTIKQIKDKTLSTLKRTDLIAAQTPQGANTNLLINCYEKTLEDSYEFTDDISLIERYSKQEIALIPGNEENFKITTPLDFKVAEMLVDNKNL